PPASAADEVARTSVSGAVAASAHTALAVHETEAPTQVIERASGATHHASVRSIPAAPAGRTTTRLAAAALGVAVLGLAAFAVVRGSSTNGTPVATRSPPPLPASDGPEVVPAAASVATPTAVAATAGAPSSSSSAPSVASA